MRCSIVSCFVLLIWCLTVAGNNRSQRNVVFIAAELSTTHKHIHTQTDRQTDRAAVDETCALRRCDEVSMSTLMC